MSKVKALLIAEECNPQWVSVPLVGWSLYKAIAGKTEAHLVTQVRNREALQQAGLVEGRDFTIIDTERLQRPIFKLAQRLGREQGKAWTSWTALMAVTYPYFEHLIWKKLGSRIAAHEFDVVHRLTPLSPTVPSLLARKCRRAGVPFVLGPLNGGVPWPKGFDRARRREREWLSYVRGAYKLLPGYSATRRTASAILIASRDTWGQMSRRYRSKCFYLPENAIDPARFTARRARFASRPLRAVFVGRLVPYKGADILLEAAASLLKGGDMTLEIIGDGPQMPELRQQISSLGLGDSVKLAGWVAHEQVQHHLAAADLFTFPSIREFGGGVALEAMAVGAVPVVVNYGGLGELVTDKTGFLIDIGTRQQIVEQLGALLRELAAHPERIDQRSPAALRRAWEQFTWDRKAEQVLEIYDWVLSRGARPQWSMPTPDLQDAAGVNNPGNTTFMERAVAQF
jgi:glycosyltransferase involved in cell wall biosynthesis